MLLEGGAEANLAKTDGYNAVIAASYNGFDELVTVLLEKKATYATPRGLLEPMLLLTPRLEPTIRASSVPRRHRSSDARAPLCTGPTRR